MSTAASRGPSTLLMLVCMVAGWALAPAAEPDDSQFDVIVQKGIVEVYSLQFEQAENTFHELSLLRPSDPAGPFFLAMVDWWRIAIDIDNTQYDDRFFAELDHVIDLCDSLLDHNPEDVNATFFKGGAIGFKGRLKFHRNDYLAAANAGRMALPLVQAASALDPQNFDILLGTGMYNYYADVIPAEYPFLKPLLLFVPAGDKQKGLRQLILASERGKYAAIETSYFLLQIYYFYEKDYPKALVLAQKLSVRFPANVLFHRYLARCYNSLGNWALAKDVWGEITRKARENYRGYGHAVEREAEYYLGFDLMSLHDYDAALPHFYRCDELSRGLDIAEASGFMAMANLKAGNIYDVQGKRDLAISQYRKVLDIKEYQDSHKQAEQFLKKPAEF